MGEKIVSMLFRSLVPLRNFAFDRKMFVFPQETLRLLAKVLQAKPKVSQENAKLL